MPKVLVWGTKTLGKSGRLEFSPKTKILVPRLCHSAMQTDRSWPWQTARPWWNGVRASHSTRRDGAPLRPCQTAQRWCAGGAASRSDAAGAGAAAPKRLLNHAANSGGPTVPSVSETNGKSTRPVPVGRSVQHEKKKTSMLMIESPNFV